MKKKKITIGVVAAVIIILAVWIATYFTGAFVHFGSDQESAVLQDGTLEIEAKIDDKYISKDELDNWVIKRIRKVENNLDLTPMEEGNADEMLKTLTEEKLNFDHDTMYEKLESKIKVCNFMTETFVKMSGDKHTYAIAEIEVKGMDMDTFLMEYDKLQTENSEENLAANLSVAPDHYYLGVTDAGELEVIETVGSNVVPSQFFISYGDETGLTSARESETYTEESVGAARTSGSVVEGGVRHQFTETDDGFKVKLLVEFPGIMPQSIVKNHEMHLVCEFSNWVKWVYENK